MAGQKHINAVLGELSDPDLPIRMGLIRPRMQHANASLRVDDPLVKAEDDLTQKMCAFIIALVWGRLRSCTDFLGYRDASLAWWALSRTRRSLRA